MANEILTDSLIARESSLILATKLGFAGTINRKYDDRFANMEAQSGDQFSIRIPPRYIVTAGETMAATPQDSTETKRTLAIGYDHVSLIFKETELLLHINNFSNQFLNSAVAALANDYRLEGDQALPGCPQHRWSHRRRSTYGAFHLPGCGCDSHGRGNPP